MHLADLICGVSRKIEQAIEARLKASGLTIVQFRVLKRLAAEDGIPMGDLAAKVFVDSPTLTKIIDKMVASADVYRGPDPQDRRRVLIFASDKGREIYDQLRAVDVDIEETLSDHIAKDQRAALVETLLALLAEPASPTLRAYSKQSIYSVTK